MSNFFCKQRKFKEKNNPYSRCERQCYDCRRLEAEKESNFDKPMPPILRFILWVIFAALFVYLLSSCSPQKRIERILDNNSALYKTDTVFNTLEILTPYVRTDTFNYWRNISDTVFLSKENLKIKYLIDTVEKSIYVSGECAQDTIFKEIPVSVRNINPNPEAGENKERKYFIIFLFLLTIIAALKIIINKNK